MTRSPIPVRPKVREADVLRAVLDYLAAKRIFHLRMNSGAFVLGTGKSRRFFRSSRPGCADVLAITNGHGFICTFTQSSYSMPSGGFMPSEPQKPAEFTTRSIPTGVYWLECKTESGRQSDAQKDFEREVTEQGMKYAIVRSIEDLKGIGL